MTQCTYIPGYTGPKWHFSSVVDNGRVYNGDVKPVRVLDVKSSLDAIFKKNDKNTFSRVLTDIAGRIGPFFPPISGTSIKYQAAGKIFGSFCDVRKFPSLMAGTYQKVMRWQREGLPNVDVIMDTAAGALGSIAKVFKFHQRIVGKGKGFDYIGLVIDVTDLIGASIMLWRSFDKCDTHWDHYFGLVPRPDIEIGSVQADGVGRSTVISPPALVGGGGSPPPAIGVSSNDVVRERGVARENARAFDPHVRETVKLKFIDSACSVAFFLSGFVLASICVMDRFAKTKRLVPGFVRVLFSPAYVLLYTSASCQALVRDVLGRYTKAIEEAGYTKNAGEPPSPERRSVYSATTPNGSRGGFNQLGGQSI